MSPRRWLPRRELFLPPLRFSEGIEGVHFFDDALEVHAGDFQWFPKQAEALRQKEFRSFSERGLRRSSDLRTNVMSVIKKRERKRRSRCWGALIAAESS